MTGADDRDGADDGDDAQLRQLRAVWLSMRDEAPSDRGLSTLLAAARTQAVAMQPASWWQRALAALRRPPVLAFASVAVLLGGALVVTRRADDVQVTATAPARSVSVEAQGAAGGAPPLSDRVQRIAISDGTVMTPGTQSADPDASRPVPTERSTQAPMRPSVGTSKLPRPDPKPKADVARGGGKADDKLRTSNFGYGVTGTQGVDDGADGADVAELVSGGAPLQQDLSRRSTSEGPASATADAAPRAPRPVSPTVGRRVAPSILENEPAPAKPAPPPARPSLEQLVRDCAAAAERGDCARVRVIAKQIAERDPAVYKQQIAPKPAIARCLTK